MARGSVVQPRRWLTSALVGALLPLVVACGPAVPIPTLDISTATPRAVPTSPARPSLPVAPPTPLLASAGGNPQPAGASPVAPAGVQTPARTPTPGSGTASPSPTSTPDASVTPTGTATPTPSPSSTPSATSTPPPAKPTAPAPAATPAPVSFGGQLGPGGNFHKYEFTYPGDRSVYTVNLYVTPDDVNVLRNAGFKVYDPDGRLIAEGGPQPGLRPNVSANVIATRDGTYLVQVHNYDPNVAIEYRIELILNPPPP